MSNLPEKLPESRIVEFLEADDECTVEIELLLELGVYSRKHGAVQALKKSFIEGVDFSQESVKNFGSGRPSDSYLLTSDCFKEMCLMADSEVGRMVRRYYIAIEKRWKKQRKNSVVIVQTDPAITQIIAQSQQMMAQLAIMSQQQANQLAEVKSKVAGIEATQQEAIASLDEIPSPEVEAETLTTRAKLNRLVRDYSAANAVHFQEVWKRVYREFRDRYHVDLKQRVKNIHSEHEWIEEDSTCVVGMVLSANGYSVIPAPEADFVENETRQSEDAALFCGYLPPGEDINASSWKSLWKNS